MPLVTRDADDSEDITDLRIENPFEPVDSGQIVNR